MKKIYLVQFEEYSDAFTAFEDYGNAYDFASVYIESMPNHGAKTASAMIRDAFLMDAGRERGAFPDFDRDVNAELDRIGAETEEYWRSRNE